MSCLSVCVVVHRKNVPLRTTAVPLQVMKIVCDTIVYRLCSISRLYVTCLPNTGIFNISNKLLVSFDILLRMREHIQKGEPPGNCAEAEVHSRLQIPHAPDLPEEQVRYLVEKLYDGFFAFEALTDRDWDSGVCGICGICPLFESGDGNCKNCTPLTVGTVNS